MPLYPIRRLFRETTLFSPTVLTREARAAAKIRGESRAKRKPAAERIDKPLPNSGLPPRKIANYGARLEHCVPARSNETGLKPRTMAIAENEGRRATGDGTGSLHANGQVQGDIPASERPKH